VWGVDCFVSGELYQDTDAMLAATAETVRQVGFRPGDRVVITAGIPFGESGQTNILKVHEIEE
jgi:pyruvate kinase